MQPKIILPSLRSWTILGQIITRIVSHFSDIDLVLEQQNAANFLGEKLEQIAIGLV